MGKIKVSFEVDLNGLESYPSKNKDSFPFLVQNVCDLVRVPLLKSLEDHCHAHARWKDNPQMLAFIIKDTTFDEHFSRQMLMNLKLEATMDDGTVMTSEEPEWAKEMQRKELPNLKES